jgi:hypothetical protein
MGGGWLGVVSVHCNVHGAMATFYLIHVHVPRCTRCLDLLEEWLMLCFTSFKLACWICTANNLAVVPVYMTERSQNLAWMLQGSPGLQFICDHSCMQHHQGRHQGH